MKIIRTIAVLTLITAGVLYWQYRRFLDYGFVLKRVLLDTINSEGITIILDYDVQNKSVYSATVKNYTFDLYINGVYAGNVSSATPFHVPSFGTSLLSLRLKVPFKADARLINLLPILKTDISKVVFELRGTLDAQAMGFTVMKIPITYSTDLKSLI